MRLQAVSSRSRSRIAGEVEALGTEGGALGVWKTCSHGVWGPLTARGDGEGPGRRLLPGVLPVEERRTNRDGEGMWRERFGLSGE